jgi:amino acid transporter
MYFFVASQNISLILATIIALPVGMANKRNDGHFIFANVENLTTWPTGWAFMLAWLSPIWTIGGFDSCVHMSEEASNAAKAVPLGILGSIGMCWGLGFVIVIVLAACIDPNIEGVLGSSFGQPVSLIDRFRLPLLNWSQQLLPRPRDADSRCCRWPRSTTTPLGSMEPWGS